MLFPRSGWPPPAPRRPGHNDAPSQETGPSLFPDAIGRDKIHRILGGAGARQEVGVQAGGDGPCRGHNDHLRPAQGKHARRLREAQVIADQHAEAPDGRVHRLVQLISRRQIAVRAQEGQVGLAVFRDQPLRADENGAVVTLACGVSLQAADNGVDAGPATGLGEGFGQGTGHELGTSLDLFRRQVVSAQEALGEDGELSALRSRVLDGVGHFAKVRRGIFGVGLELKSSDTWHGDLLISPGKLPGRELDPGHSEPAGRRQYPA